MIIAFYKVNNSNGFCPDSFKSLSENEIVEKIMQLPDDEFRLYDTMHYGYGAIPSPNMADFENDYNDEEIDGGWWCVMLQKTNSTKENKMEEMVSDQAYDEIVEKVKKNVGDDAAEYILPAVIKALEEGSGDVREQILLDWLAVDSVRVCTQCGAIMQEGWYLCCNGYACSDECAAKSEGITMEEFDKWRIYKDDIVSYLEDEGEGRKIEDLTKEECEKIIEEYCDDCDYYWTEWF